MKTYEVPAYRISLVKDSSAKVSDKPSVRSSAEVYSLMKHYYVDADRESFHILMLDAKNKIIGVSCISTGSLTSSLAHPREAFKPVVAWNDAQRGKAEKWALESLTPEQQQSLNKQICEIICRHSCCAIILAHNHPSGDPTPSQEDLHTTRRLRDIGDIMGVRVLDHVIVGEGKYVSFVDDGYWEK